MFLSYVDIVGSGFVPGVSGIYANCRVYYQGEVVGHVGPLYQEWSEDVPVQPVVEASVVEPIASEPLVFGTGG